ncbi:MAG: sigma-70 family RNA polymerase sigma factor [Acidimicrobiia bacterium]|nr:sigma-70 family RNA polymerase sigma factor [Acidimicrobiia bacterium]
MRDARGAPDREFERLFAEYGPSVRAWLAVRAPAGDADDLFQDVWTIFCRRWREWTPHPQAEAGDDRPVLSFLYRTCHLVLLAHRRVRSRRAMLPLEESPEPASDGLAERTRQIQIGECLSAARACCSDEDLAVLTAKLSGVPARDIARTLRITESAVDHRYRATVGRIRDRLSGASA